jgi:hypothetical protein
MTQADAAEIVLRELRQPLHREAISGEILKRNFPVWSHGKPGKTPWESVGRALTQEIANRGSAARFEYVGGKGSGVFRLRIPADASESSDDRRRPRLAADDGVRAIRLTDGDLLSRIGLLKMDPEQFVRVAVLRALRDAEIRKLEEEHRQGYERIPVQPDEFVEMDPEAWDEL